MAKLELLSSGPGTGKTFYCIDLFKKEVLKTKSGIQSRSFFILPNREHAECIQYLILRKDIPGLFNAHILTINDLAAKILGVSAVRPPNDTLRKNIIREIFEDFSFGYFGEMGRFNGFYELLADSIKEFKAGLLGVKEFEKTAQSLLKDPVFRSKFRDLSIVLKNYGKRLDALGLREPEDALMQALKEIAHAPPADLVIFDGFYHFTRAQRALIQSIASWSSHTVVTLTLSDQNKQRLKLFEYPGRTRAFLMQIGFKEKKNTFKVNHRTKDPALLHLERYLFFDKPPNYAKPQISISLIKGQNMRLEVETIAREIKKLYRESSCYFSDICLILRQIQGYEKMIRSVFMSFGIPVYVHERSKLIENGLARVLCRFLALDLEGWKREDLLFVLKSSYFSKKMALDEALCLETMAISENLLEGRERWAELSKRPETSLSVREVLGELLESNERLAAAKNVREFNLRIIAWLDAVDLNEADLLAKEAIRSILKSAETFYERSLNRGFLAASFLKELKDSLEAGLFSVKPKGKNRVQVYDVIMALPKEYKAVFLPGLLEKVFPQNISEDPLFKDQERRAMNRSAVVFEERLPRIAGERYFFYMAVTRAKERLYLSCPKTNADGRPALASFFVEEAEKCFKEGLPLLHEKSSDLLPEPQEWESEYEMTRGLSEIIFRTTPKKERAGHSLHPDALEAYDYCADKESFKEVLKFGFSKQKALLNDPRIKQFFSDLKGPFSATKLESFATCAFKYFSDRILNLKEPLEGREAMEMGSLLHKTLEEFYKDLSAAQRESGAFLQDTPKMKALLRDKLDFLMKKSPFRNEPLYRQSIVLDSMRTILDLFSEHEKELFKKRGFIPSYFELKFGKPSESDLDYLRIKSLDGDILIEGQIDRVDVSKDRTRALVIDYKRSSREFKVKDRLEMGLEFQLPIYILAVRRLLDLDVAGAELRILKSAKEEGIYRESDRQMLGLSAQARLYDENAYESNLKNTEELIRKNLTRLRGAEIEVNSKSCKYCSFSPVCRFEPWRLVYSEEK